MKQISILILVLAMVVGTTANCLSSPLQGTLFSSTTQHVYGAANGGQLGSASVSKKGVDCSFGSLPFLSLFFYGGGASIQHAMKDGGITKIATIDRSSMNVIGPIFHRECVIVWGQ